MQVRSFDFQIGKQRTAVLSILQEIGKCAHTAPTTPSSFSPLFPAIDFILLGSELSTHHLINRTHGELIQEVSYWSEISLRSLRVFLEVRTRRRGSVEAAALHLLIYLIVYSALCSPCD